MSNAPVLLVVDDEVDVGEVIVEFGRRLGYDARLAASYDEAMALAHKESPELAVVDLRMPGPSGLELVRDLLKLDATTRIVVVTGYGSIATAIDAVRLGAVHYLQKPADADEILAAFARGDSPPLVPVTTEFDAPSLERVKWEHISRVMSDCGGNISEAARKLKLHRRTLQRILQKYPPSS